jgi:hypothetical protein
MGVAKWKQVADRVAGMDRAELRDRLRQEIGKRQDGLLARLGLTLPALCGDPVTAEAGTSSLDRRK